MNQVILVGYGYVGEFLRKTYLSEGREVLALRKTPGENTLVYDLDQGVLPQNITFTGAEVIYLAPPQSEGIDDLRIRHFLKQISGKSIDKILYYSTTGVYGDLKDAWADEQTPCNPSNDRAKRRLDAENQVKQFAQNEGIDYVILRVSGIYGPNRLPLESVKSGRPVIKYEESPWSNRIHVEDLVEVTILAMERGIGVYNVSDGTPERMTQLYFHLADILGVGRPQEVPKQVILEAASPMMREFLENSRKISSQRMIEELGVDLKYANWLQGLQASIEG